MINVPLEAMVSNESDSGVVDEVLLDGEDPGTADLDLATRWMQVYAEMLRLSASLEATRPAEVGSLRRQAELYRRRMAFWRERCLAIRGQ